MPEPLLHLLKSFAAMTPADRKAVEIRLGEAERAVLRRRLQSSRGKPAAPQAKAKYNFEAYSAHVAKRLTEILVIGNARSGVTEATAVALAALAPTTESRAEGS